MTKDTPGRGVLGYLCCCCVRSPQALVTVKVISAVDLEKQDMTGAGTVVIIIIAIIVYWFIRS